METLDWTAQTNQYDLRVRRPGGPIDVKIILDRPRQGVDADSEFAANWANADANEVNENWHILSVTDMALLVTYLPATLAWYPAGPFFYNRDHYVVPDRQDNPRFYEATLLHKQQPGLKRGYSFVVSNPLLHPSSIGEELRQHGLLRGDWKLAPGSIQEIGLEQHHYLTWQRQQLPNYYRWQEALAEPALTLTKQQTALMLNLVRAGYLLRHGPQGWEVGQLTAPNQTAESTYQTLVVGRATPAEAILEATKRLLPSA